MHAIIMFTYEIVSGLFTLAIFAMIAAAILSWLVAFDILNVRNPAIYQIDRFFSAVTRPIVAPFQRFVPLFGGVDISFVIAILVLGAAQRWLLPAIFGGLDRLFGG